jgi:hypothetical protein
MATTSAQELAKQSVQEINSRESSAKKAAVRPLNLQFIETV